MRQFGLKWACGSPRAHFIDCTPDRTGVRMELFMSKNNLSHEELSDLCLELSMLLHAGTGVGDALFSSIPMTIFGAIAAYMALEGSMAGIFFGAAFGIAMIWARKKLFDMGYAQGIRILDSFSGSIGNLINAVGVLGLMVVGALISTTVKLTTALVFTRGEVVMEIQPVLEIGRAGLICAMVGQGAGISYLPDYITRKEKEEGRIAYLPVTDFDIEIWKQLLYHRDKWVSPQMESVLQYCIDTEFTSANQEYGTDVYLS